MKVFGVGQLIMASIFSELVATPSLVTMNPKKCVQIRIGTPLDYEIIFEVKELKGLI